MLQDSLACTRTSPQKRVWLVYDLSPRGRQQWSVESQIHSNNPHERMFRTVKSNRANEQTNPRGCNFSPALSYLSGTKDTIWCFVMFVDSPAICVHACMHACMHDYQLHSQFPVVQWMQLERTRYKPLIFDTFREPRKYDEDDFKGSLS